MRFSKEVEINRFVWALSGLMLVGLLGTPSVCLSAELIWTKKADMPTPRWFATSAQVGGRIYVIGGASSEPDAKGLSAVEEYDPSTDTWTKKADMPIASALLSLSSPVVDGKIYVIGGLGLGYQTLSVVEEYDPVKDTWARKTDMPTPRYGLAACAVDGRIYVIGGGSSWPPPGAGLATVDVYDPATDTWTKKAEMPTGLYCPSASVVNGKIYVLGGRPTGGPAEPYVQEYDPATNTWTRKHDMLVATSSMGSVVLDDKIVVVGGWLHSGSPPYTAVQVYDPAKDLWTREADGPFLKACFSTEVVNGRIHAIGGTDRPHPCPATSTIYVSSHCLPSTGAPK